MNALSPWSEITYFVGTPAQAMLRPVHFATMDHAMKNFGVGGRYLFVYRHEELLLVIDHSRLWFRGYKKWGKMRGDLKSINGRYSWEDLLHRYVRCAISKALAT